jgi:hypothetical protein
MKLATAIVLLLAALVFVVTVHLHDEAHGYDVVGAGEDSGGSQETEGSTEVTGYLVDHKAGRVWLVEKGGQIPVRVFSCASLPLHARADCEPDPAKTLCSLPEKLLHRAGCGN